MVVQIQLVLQIWFHLLRCHSSNFTEEAQVDTKLVVTTDAHDFSLRSPHSADSLPVTLYLRLVPDMKWKGYSMCFNELS